MFHPAWGNSEQHDFRHAAVVDCRPNSRHQPFCVRFCNCFTLVPLISGRPLLQASSREVEVDQCHKAEHLCFAFCQPVIAHLAIAQLAFDDAEHMLGFGPHDAVFLVALLLRSRQNPPRLALVFYRPGGPPRAGCPCAAWCSAAKSAPPAETRAALHPSRQEKSLAWFASSCEPAQATKNSAVSSPNPP